VGFSFALWIDVVKKDKCRNIALKHLILIHTHCPLTCLHER